MATVGIIHISDLHMGASISGRGGFRMLPSATAHDEAALDALFRALDKIMPAAANHPVALVVSGDVSAWGAAAELSMYLTIRDVGYRHDALVVHPPLVKDFDGVVDIPGNHDYWNGRLLNPWVNFGARRFFPKQPWYFAMRTDSHLITLSGICSTLGSSHTEQFSAVGRFHSVDRRWLKESLDRADLEAQNEGLESFKLVVTHHSPSYGSDIGNGLCTRSITELSILCAQKDVKGLLTGHVHAFGSSAKHNLPAETRCGTTTQRDLLAMKWIERGVGKAAHPLNFLYHEFNDDNGPMTWKITPWEYNRINFLPTQSVPIAF